jgi:hypothetical protein
MVLPGPFGFSRVVFLSHVLTASGPTFPGDPPVEIYPAATLERTVTTCSPWWRARRLLREHRIHLENLSGLGEMPPSGGWVIVGASGSGAARARRPPCSGWSLSRTGR